MTDTTALASPPSAMPADLQHMLRNAIDEARLSGSRVLPEPLGKLLLRGHGVATPRGAVIHATEELGTATSGLTAPYVLKAVSSSVVHKSDVGGVRVGIASVEQLADEITAMGSRLRAAGHDVDAFLVEEMAPAGQEIVVGAVRDSRSGPVVMLGLGGVFVEVLRDVAFRLCPVTRQDIEAMLAELRGRALLDGVRGEPPADVAALLDVVFAVAGAGGLLENLPEEVVEVDLNPVIVSAHGAVVVDARLVLGSGGSSAPAAHPEPPPTDFAALLNPRTIAVVGASTRNATPANLFIRNLREFGFPGEIYPVHRTAEQVEGLPAWRSLGETPNTVDYAYVAVPAAAVPRTVGAAGGRVRFAQVISSGFGETAEGVDLERDLVAAARRAGVRLLGPNCLGTHSARGRITFIDRSPRREGPVAVVSQSGGLSVDILRLGEQRGVRFSGVVSLGNGADVTPAELLTHFLGDPGTEVVALYLESLAEGRRVLDVLRAHPSPKPVVLLAGGRTASGARAALSHTGALAGNHLLWPALAQQAGMVLVDTLPELVDALLAFQQRDPVTRSDGSDVVLFGNGGGTSVLATDALEREGLVVPALGTETVEALLQLELPPGASLVNPLDAPAWTLAIDDGKVAERILSAVLEIDPPAAVISHFNVGIIVSNTKGADTDVMAGLVEAIARCRDRSSAHTHHLLVLRSDGDPGTEESKRSYRQRALDDGLAVFDELSDAAAAAAALLHYDRLRTSRGER